MTKIMSLFVGVAMLLSPFVFTDSAHAIAPAWDTTGNYDVVVVYENTIYGHNMSLSQNSLGELMGNGTSSIGNNTYTTMFTSGTVDGNSINFTADYNNVTLDSESQSSTVNVEGAIAPDGTLSGTWSDNASSTLSGTWSSTSGTATPIQMVADVDNDGYVSAAEGVPFYGEVVYSLTTSGDMSSNSALALDRFPVADSNGNYTYTRILTLADDISSGLEGIAVVVHGADINENGIYDGEKRSTLDPELPFEGTVPVACGIVYETSTNDYSADLSQLNSTGVIGGVNIQKNGNEVTVNMTVENTSPNLAHAQHFHLGGNGTCPPNTIGVMQEAGNGTSTVKVIVEKFVQGVMATAQTANNADFPMAATWNAENTGLESGDFVLSENNTTPYQATSVEMTKGAYYVVEELLDGDVVAPTCESNIPFALTGYTTGNTRAEAMAAVSTTTKPVFEDLQQDKYVIVWNRDCALPPIGGIGGDVIGGEGILEVTSIEMIDTTAIADGSFESGWKYIFHVTVPMNERNVSMKFDDWIRTGGGGSILVANNMRISSSQADNDGATVLLTAADTYPTSALHMIDDLDPDTNGRQVEITLEVAVPNGTPNGSYTTSYSVRSL